MMSIRRCSAVRVSSSPRESRADSWDSSDDRRDTAEARDWRSGVVPVVRVQKMAGSRCGYVL